MTYNRKKSKKRHIKISSRNTDLIIQPFTEDPEEQW